jgi:hypothetical protein
MKILFEDLYFRFSQEMKLSINIMRISVLFTFGLVR